MAITPTSLATNSGRDTAFIFTQASIPLTGVIAKRLLVAYVAVDKSSGLFTLPVGWNPQIVKDGASVSIAVVTKVAVGDETSVTFDWTTGQQGYVAEVLQMPEGVSETILTKLDPAYSDIAVTSISTGTTAALTGDGAVMALWAIDTDQVPAVPAGWDYSGGVHPSNGNPGTSVLVKEVLAGSTAEATWTVANADQQTTALLAFASTNVTNPKMGTLVDDFSTDLSKWPHRSPEAVIESGRVKIPYELPNQYRYIASRYFYDLNDSSLSAFIVPPSTTTTGTELYMETAYDSNNRFRMYLSGGKSVVYVDMFAAGVRTILTEFPYNESIDAWWRIREGAGTVYFETSSNGTDWVVRRSAVHNVAKSLVQEMGAGFSVGDWSAGAVPGRAFIDNVNITGTSPPTIIAAATQNVLWDDPITLTATGTNYIDLSWSITASPAGSIATINNPTSANATFIPDKAGAYTFSVTATGSGTATSRASTSVYAQMWRKTATGKVPIRVRKAVISDAEITKGFYSKDFDVDILDWRPRQVGSAITASSLIRDTSQDAGGGDNSASLKWTTNAPGTTAVEMESPVVCTGGNRYVLSVWIKHNDTVARDVAVHADLFNATGYRTTITSQNVNVMPDTWVEAKVSAISLIDDTEIRFAARVSDAPTGMNAWIDRVRVVETIPSGPASFVADDGSGTGTHTYANGNNDLTFYMEGNTSSSITRSGGIIFGGVTNGSDFRMWTKKLVGGPGNNIRIRTRIRATEIRNVTGGIPEGVKLLLRWVSPINPDQTASGARGISPWPHPDTGQNMSSGSIEYVPMTTTGYQEINKTYWGSTTTKSPVSRTNGSYTLGSWVNYEMTLEWLSNPTALRITTYKDGVQDFQWVDKGDISEPGGEVFNWGLYAGVSADRSKFEVDSFIVEAINAKGNLLTTNQATVELDSTGFQNRYSSGSVAHTTAVAAEGRGALLMTKDSTVGTMHTGTSPRTPVTAGNYYGARVSTRAATIGRSSNIRLVWRNAAGVETTTTPGAAGAITSNTTQWADLSYKVRAPADAVEVQIQVETLSCDAGEQHYADKWGLWDLGTDFNADIPIWEPPPITVAAAPGLVHALSPRYTSPTDSLKQRLVFGHVMTNTHPTSDDKHYLLVYKGNVSTATSLPSGLKLADYGTAYRTTDTGHFHHWTGSSWKNHGLRPAFDKVGASYPNPDDYWHKHFLPPAPDDLTDQAFMGEHRNVAPYMPRRGGTTDNFYIQNAKEYIRDAIRLGQDGFGIYMNQIGDNSTHWPRTMRYVRAAEQVWNEDGTPFLCILQPDCKTSATSSVKIDSSTVNINASADALANQILKVASNKALLKVGNKIVIAPFGAERWPRGVTQTAADRLTFWTRFKSTMKAGGTEAFFIPMFLGTFTQYMDAGWDAIVDMPSLWGDRDPTTTAGLTATHALRNTKSVGTAWTKYTKPFFFTVADKDQRPRESVFWENGGWDNFRQMWKNAIGTPGSSTYRRADWVHYVTWNDYPEGSEMDNSVMNGDVVADYGRYYQEWWRTGRAPQILRDGLYLRHRRQPYNTAVTYTGTPEVGLTSPLIQQTKFIERTRGNTSARDEIDVEARLVSDATVEILVNNIVVKSQACTAGINRVVAPMKNGNVSARVIRDGAVVSKVVSDTPISTTQPHQDLYPRSFSSLRQGT